MMMRNKILFGIIGCVTFSMSAFAAIGHGYLEYGEVNKSSPGFQSGVRSLPKEEIEKYLAQHQFKKKHNTTQTSLK
jgi:hypothetical protein